MEDLVVQMTTKNKKEKVIDDKNSNFIYCSNRKCKNEGCLRFWRNAPWNKLFKQTKYECNKNGTCMYYTETAKKEEEI